MQSTLDEYVYTSDDTIIEGEVDRVKRFMNEINQTEEAIEDAKELLGAIESIRSFFINFQLFFYGEAQSLLGKFRFGGLKPCLSSWKSAKSRLAPQPEGLPSTEPPG